MIIHNKKFIISQLSEYENVSNVILAKYINSFVKYIKSEIRKYNDKSGLDCYKMNKCDYNILYNLYINTDKSPYKLHILLLYIYSYYKLDGMTFNKDYFPLKLFFKFIKQNINMHSLILNMIVTYQ